MSNYKLNDFVDIPSLIKEVRKNKNLSQDRLGIRAGVSGKCVSSYERGRNIPPLEVFIKILNIGGYALEIKENIYKTPKKLTVPLS